jgi:hypothetical protein
MKMLSEAQDKSANIFLLPYSCHLAPLAGWPDTVRFRYPWSSHLHYVNPVNDEPPKHCTYGEDGWQDRGTGNVLEGKSGR